MYACYICQYRMIRRGPLDSASIVSHEFTIEQCPVQLLVLANSMRGKEIANEFVRVLYALYGIGPSFLLAAMRDSALVNNVALKVIYSMLVDM